MKNKIITFFVFFSIIILAFPQSLSANKTPVNFIQYLQDGTTTTFTMDVYCHNDESLSSAISRKCEELFYKTIDIEQLADTGVDLYFVISAGSGLHFVLPPSLIQSTFFDIILSLFPSLLYCSYSDSEAESDIISLTASGNETILQGQHRILCIGFVGILGWTGIFSYGNAGFAGLTPFFWSSEE
jgi:hypothetical protein